MRSLSLFGLVFVGVLGLFSQACVPLEVRAREELDISIDLDAILKAQGIDKNKRFPGGKIPPDLKLKIPFWYSTKFDIRNQEQIKKYKDQIRDFRINQLSYEVQQNTVNVEIPSFGNRLKVFLGEYGLTKTDEFQEIGFLFPIPAGKNNIADRLQFGEGGEEKAGTFFKSLAFQFAVQGTVEIDGSKSSVIPGGKMKLKLIVDINFGLNVTF